MLLSAGPAKGAQCKFKEDLLPPAALLEDWHEACTLVHVICEPPRMSCINAASAPLQTLTGRQSSYDLHADSGQSQICILQTCPA